MHGLCDYRISSLALRQHLQVSLQDAEPLLDALVGRWFTTSFAATNADVIERRKQVAMPLLAFFQSYACLSKGV